MSESFRPGTPPPALIALAVALSAWPAAAQPPFLCEGIDPPNEICVPVGPSGSQTTECFYHYRDCQFDYDGQEGFERRARFFERRGSASDPPFITDGDRHCYQGEVFEPPDPPAELEPDADDFWYHRFAVLFPAGNEDGPFPLFASIRGGGQGWVETEDPTENAWRLNLDAASKEDWFWEVGNYRGSLQHAQGSENESVMMDFLFDENGITQQIRDTYPEWAIMVVSYCSHDGYNGRPELASQEFRDAAQTRFGFVALYEALEFVEAEYDVDFLWAAGTSSGGLGAYLLARDLVDTDSDWEDHLHGAVVDSQVLQTDKLAELYTLDDGPTNPDRRDVDHDDVCADTERTVVCDIGAEPLAPGFDEIGLSGLLANEDIEPDPPGTPSRLEAPIFHLWNKRDPQFCYDACYDEEHLHGLVATAIYNQSNDQDDDEIIDLSENLQVCFGSCEDANGEIVDCSEHGLLGARFNTQPMQGALACTMDWIAAVELYWGGNTYTAPQCLSNQPPPEGLSGSPPPCSGGFSP